jgi:hypothetical protein
MILQEFSRYSNSTPLNVIISTTGPIHTGFVASERKFSWPHFSITILAPGKYHDYVISHSKTLKSPNIYFGILLRFLFPG